ncbi:pancreatic alpha-amylase-like isoform X2 [Amblyomma americanum]
MSRLHWLAVWSLAFTSRVSCSKNPNMAPGRSVVVQLFEWRFDEIAKECEVFLGPRGYGAVQTSPVHENAIVFEENVKRPWYERYQPVSYKIQNRSGNETLFHDMVRRCNRAGVRVYVDVILNHMTGANLNHTGTAGTPYTYKNCSYPGVPYGPGEFHTRESCGSASGSIEDYKNARQVRNCELVGLRDLDQSKKYVREKMVELMNKLIRLGVAGFRMDAAKHMWPKDLKKIFAKLDDLTTEFFPRHTRPFIYQEVIDMDTGDAVTRWQYQGLGRVTEFLYGAKLGAVLRKRTGMLLKYVRNFGEGWGFLPGGDALIFIDNHDNQRTGGADILTFFDSRLYKMAVAFMLAWPYGLPRVMSSYRWPRYFREGRDINAWIGPPSDEAWRIKPVVRLRDDTCGNGWVCEHRWRQIYNLVQLRKVAGDNPVTTWWDNGANAIAFGRGNSTLLVINNEDHSVDITLQTQLPAGKYCDVVSGSKTAAGCTGRTVTVDAQGKTKLRVDSGWEDPMVAVHVEAKL